MKELICRIVGPDAHVADAYNQIKARMLHMTAIKLGQPGERTSYARLENPDTGELIEMLHIDEVGIVRVGEYVAPNRYPVWKRAAGAHDAYPAHTLKGEVTRVRHKGKIWENIHGDGNSWEPGVFGWEEVPE